MREFFIGIDPGLGGAVAVLHLSGHTKMISDVPTLRLPNGRRIVDAEALISELAPYRRRAQVFVEQVGARPTDSRVGAFAFGRAVGAIEAAAIASGLALQRVNPTVWKRAVGLPAGADKEASIEAARRLIPGSAPVLTAKCHDGRAEALLIAWYGLNRLGVHVPPRPVAVEGVA